MHAISLKKKIDGGGQYTIGSYPHKSGGGVGGGGGGETMDRYEQRKYLCHGEICQKNRANNKVV